MPPGGLATFTDVTIGFPEASTAGAAVGAPVSGFPPYWTFFVPAAGNSAGSYFLGTSSPTLVSSSSFFSSSGTAAPTAPFFWAGFGST